jgi:hypothetical protein
LYLIPYQHIHRIHACCLHRDLAILQGSLIDNMVSENCIVVVVSHQVSGVLYDGDVAILNLKDGVYYGLDPVGGRIWSLIQEPRSVAEVRDILLEEYEVDHEQCTHEVIKLFEDLLTRGLIQVSNGAAA